MNKEINNETKTQKTNKQVSTTQKLKDSIHSQRRNQNPNFAITRKQQ